jgi:Adenylate and Guanylate cyclase catalytic domain
MLPIRVNFIWKVLLWTSRTGRRIINHCFNRILEKTDHHPLTLQLRHGQIDMEPPAKTMMCSVLFLDIVDYSKMSVVSEIAAKERLNSFLSDSISDVPVDDRIILDTGDGAALSFLSDVEQPITVALRMRDLLRSSEAQADPQLLVRMGINVGPVRLIKDINGQLNVVGDGINVAQRVMNFCTPGQILISRAYYEAISRLSPIYTKMFFYQGSRTDKHVREHQIYATGFSDRLTDEPELAAAGAQLRRRDALSRNVREAGRFLARRIDFVFRAAASALRAASSGKKAALLGALVLPLLVLASQVTILAARAPRHAEQTSVAVNGNATAPPRAAAAPGAAGGSFLVTLPHPFPPSAVSAQYPSPTNPPPPFAELPQAAQDNGRNAAAGASPAAGHARKPGTLSVTCRSGSRVFVDGDFKGTIDGSRLAVQVDPGPHELIVNNDHMTKVFTQDITVGVGKTYRIHPSACE